MSKTKTKTVMANLQNSPCFFGSRVVCALSFGVAAEESVHYTVFGISHLSIYLSWLFSFLLLFFLRHILFSQNGLSYVFEILHGVLSHKRIRFIEIFKFKKSIFASFYFSCSWASLRKV